MKFSKKHKNMDQSQGHCGHQAAMKAWAGELRTHLGQKLARLASNEDFNTMTIHSF
jgi:hypothetical protein